MDHTETEMTKNTSYSILQMDPLEIAERVKVMRLQEETTYKCSDFFGVTTSNKNRHQSQLKKQQRNVDESCRTKLCEWSYKIMKFCNFHHETADIAMMLLDRFVGQNCTAAEDAMKDKRQYQLAAMATIYIAIKLFEPVEIDSKSMAEISQGEYTALEICNMEQTILNALQWRVNGPTRFLFAQYFLALLPSEVQNDSNAVSDIIHLVQLQNEFATKDYFFTTRKQSTTALAFVLNALDAAKIEACHRREFIKSLSKVITDMNPFSVELWDARSRLLASTGFKLPQLILPSPTTTDTIDGLESTKGTPEAKQSKKNGRHFDWKDEDDEDEENYDANDTSPVCVRQQSQSYWTGKKTRKQ